MSTRSMYVAPLLGHWRKLQDNFNPLDPVAPGRLGYWREQRDKVQRDNFHPLDAMWRPVGWDTGECSGIISTRSMLCGALAGILARAVG